MCRVGLSFLLLGLWATTAFAQTELDLAERIRLHELLRVSITTEFTLQPKGALPAQLSYQVFLGFGLDFETRKNFVRWLEEWNRKRAARYATLVVTEDLQQAQIILARFPGDETVTDITSYAMKSEGSVYDKANTQREYHTAFFSYVLLPLQAAPLRLQAIWRNLVQVKRKAKDARSTEEGNDAGWQLRNALFDLLKRHKKQP